MKTYDNSGKLIGEINVVVIPTEAVVTTNTLYGPGERVVSQTITRREFSGAVRTFEILSGKLLP